MKSINHFVKCLLVRCKLCSIIWKCMCDIQVVFGIETFVQQSLENLYCVWIPELVIWNIMYDLIVILFPISFVCILL